MRQPSVTINGKVEIRRTFVDPTESQIPSHQALLKYWDDLRGTRWAPTWPEVSLMRLPPVAIPFVVVTDIVHENGQPISSCYRFWGSGLTQYYGKDYTGKYVNEIPPRSSGIANDSACIRIANERVPHLEIKEFITPKGLLAKALKLRVPLSDNGETVDHGLGIFAFEADIKERSQVELFNKIFESLDEFA